MSPVILPDTSAAEDMDPSVAGTYKGSRIVKTDAQLSREKKVPQAVIQFEIPNVPREDSQELRTVKRTVWLNTTGAGSMQFDKLLRSLGQDDIADRIRAGEKVPFDTDDLLYSKCQKTLAVIMRVGTYEGRRRDEVAGFLPE